jgi:hypothetical protein
MGRHKYTEEQKKDIISISISKDINKLIELHQINKSKYIEDLIIKDLKKQKLK